jgi:hypothetical protein
VTHQRSFLVAPPKSLISDRLFLKLVVPWRQIPALPHKYRGQFVLAVGFLLLLPQRNQLSGYEGSPPGAPPQPCQFIAIFPLAGPLVCGGLEQPHIHLAVTPCVSHTVNQEAQVNVETRSAFRSVFPKGTQRTLSKGGKIETENVKRMQQKWKTMPKNGGKM